MACLLGQPHALVDGGAGGDAVHVENLEGPHAQRDANFGVELCVGPGEKCARRMVELNLPAQYAENQCSGQMTVWR